MKRKIIAIFVVLVMSLMPVGAFAADQNIAEIAIDNGNFTTLVAALEKADLVGAVSGKGPLTVFAPTDEAFAKLLKQLNISKNDLLNHPQLKEILLFHVVSGKVMSKDLTNGMKVPTLNGESLTVNLTNGAVKINGATVVTPNIEATNGVIHVIDTVLVPSDFVLKPEPKTVVDIALADDNFSILVAALKKADLVGALQGKGPFTVFAPTNKAFEDLLVALNISANDLLNQPDLAKVLLYHVVPGKIMSKDLTNNLEAATLNGEMVKFDLSSGVKVSGSNVTAADMVAGNGVVHVIDKVLVPSNFKLQKINPVFSDVKEIDWYYQPVMKAHDNGWFTGTSATTFGPNMAMTRGMLATVLWRIEGEATAKAHDFKDVAVDKYYNTGIAWAAEHGIVSGYGHNMFGPEDNITREQLATVLYNYAKYKGRDVSASNDLSGFIDANHTTAYAHDAIKWAVGSGIVNGKGGGVLDPKGDATRAEVAMMLVNFLKK